MIFFEIIGIACFAAIVAELSGIMDQVKWVLFHKEFEDRTMQVYHDMMYNRKRLKPLDCPPCLAFWTGLIYFFAKGYPWEWVVLAPFICAVLAIGIVKAIKGRGI